MTRKWGPESLLRVNFGSLWGRYARVTLESLLGHFKILSVFLGRVRRMPTS